MYKTSPQHNLLITQMHNNQSYRQGEKKGDHVCSDDKRLVVFRTGMEKPPTFCHLSNGCCKFELGQQQQQLHTGVHILTTVPWSQRLGKAAAWLLWPDTACWATTVSEHTWENRHTYIYIQMHVMLLVCTWAQMQYRNSTVIQKLKEI